MFFNLVILVVLFLVDFAPASCEVNGFTYNGFQSGNLSLDGIAELTPNGLLLLTNSKTQDMGHAFYPNPIHFKNSPNATAFSFSTTFVFAIRSEYGNLSGHGLVFVIAPHRGLQGALANHYLGLFNSINNGNRSNRVVGVELDTIYSEEFGDINDNHVGIDVNELKSVAVQPTGYFDDTGSFHNLTLVSGQPMQVWVDYDGRTKQINVTIAPLLVGKPDVRVIPSLKKRLIFVGQLDDEEHDIKFENGWWKILGHSSRKETEFAVGWPYLLSEGVTAPDQKRNKTVHKESRKCKKVRFCRDKTCSHVSDSVKCAERFSSKCRESIGTNRMSQRASTDDVGAWEANGPLRVNR
ncbi:hypothetical protein HAX54_040305 [Datura stramonium]|uniref:Legume lectin domain-containing protein n=1 Tax=Datura stramonium TaxID=4076 RepID=A0ABS8VMG1_DATST|nr:hypothetical protein [Datura stramonium]